MENARTRAKNRYNKKNYDMLSIRFPKGIKELIKEEATRQEKSTARYVLEAISEKFNRETGREFEAAVIESIQRKEKGDK